MIDKAIEFATRAHRGQFRKGTRRPYIVHPIEVGDIVCSMTTDEEVISAAYLHDTIEDCEGVTEELIDRYGDIPRKVMKLLEVATLKALAHSVYVTAVEQKGEQYIFTMYEKAKVRPEKIPELIQQYKGDLTFKPEEPPVFIYEEKKKNRKAKAVDALVVVKNVLNAMKALLDT